MPTQVAISRSGFSGCVKRLKLDGQLLGAPTRVVGATPCFSGPLEKGLFFAGSGGAITLGLSPAGVPQSPTCLGWGGSDAQNRAGGPGAEAFLLSRPLPADTLGATLPDLGLELEVRPQTATGLVFHLGRGPAPPYLELRVLGRQVSGLGRSLRARSGLVGPS